MEENQVPVVDELMQEAEAEVAKRLKERKVRMIAQLLEEKRDRTEQLNRVLEKIDHRIAKVKAMDFIQEGGVYCDCDICR